MTCDQIPKLASSYIGRDLSAVIRLKFAFHLVQCKSCRAYMRGFLKARDLAVQSLQMPAPDALMQALGLHEDDQKVRG
ncbi:hypothetical protein [Falsirhodobacter sp. alg1]|uniref:hypothetical protein n=1 Tax=Falsirhodobacter sp. alg1 TaxID=1472418 RepID=UPI0005EF24E5|nr:hypothetical protein [Falsirhodobacter sp. alg1]